MPPYLPVMGISRSQSVRLGRGIVPELNSGDIPTNPQTGALIGPFYADLGNPLTRRDYQHHNAIGAIIDTGTTSNTVYSDLFSAAGLQPAGLAVTAGTGFALNVSAGAIQSRFSGAQINIPAISGQTLVPAAPPAVGGRTDQVVVNAAGAVSLIAGVADTAAPIYDVWTVAVTGGTSTFKLSFTYNGSLYTTGAIAVTALASAVATAVLAATGGPNNSAFSGVVGASTVTGGGGALGTAPVTLTASGGLEGPITNMFVTGYAGTAATFAVTHTTTGVGQVPIPPVGDRLILANVYVPSTAASAANYVISTGMLQTS